MEVLKINWLFAAIEMVFIKNNITEDAKIEMAMRTASCKPVYLTMPEYVLIALNTRVLMININPTELITIAQSTPINVKFCLIAIANKKENKVAPRSIKNITHLGTILKFLNMNLLF